jgi:hypothetical protein
MYFSNTKALRDYLSELLRPLLGTMTLPSGAVVPAVFVGEPPVGSVASGLALNFPKMANGSSGALTGGTASTRRFQFYLVQHPGTEKLNEATDLVSRALKPVNWQYIPGVQNPDGQQLTLDQCIFSFNRSALVL